MQVPLQQTSFITSLERGSAASSLGCHVKRRVKRQQQGRLYAKASAAGGGGGSGGGTLKGYGGGGDESHNNGRRKFTFSGWEARVAADPQFVYKVMVEQIIGVGAAVVGDMSSRPFWGLYELDFVFSTLIVASILNFSLMYLLAPTASVGSAAPAGLLASIFSERILKSWGAPGGHMFEAGFQLSSRLLNLGYKGCVFALVGLFAGLVGTSVSNGLIAVRKRLDPEFVPQNELPNLPLNAACWAAHMGVSSNVRYQLLNGIEMVLGTKLSPLPFRLVSTAIRIGNNVIGGISFVLLAKILGVQSSKGDEIVAEHEGVEPA